MQILAGDIAWFDIILWLRRRHKIQLSSRFVSRLEKKSNLKVMLLFTIRKRTRIIEKIRWRSKGIHTGIPQNVTPKQDDKETQKLLNCMYLLQTCSYCLRTYLPTNQSACLSANYLSIYPSIPTYQPTYLFTYILYQPNTYLPSTGHLAWIPSRILLQSLLTRPAIVCIPSIDKKKQEEM